MSFLQSLYWVLIFLLRAQSLHKTNFATHTGRSSTNNNEHSLKCHRLVDLMQVIDFTRLIVIKLYQVVGFKSAKIRLDTIRSRLHHQAGAKDMNTSSYQLDNCNVTCSLLTFCRQILHFWLWQKL